MTKAILYKRFRVVILPLAILFLLASLGALQPAAASDEVVARVNDVTITQAELEQSVSSELDKIDQQRRQLLEDALKPLLDSRLLDAEAKKRGISTDELIEAEVTSQAEPATDADVDAWFDQNRSRVRGTKEQLSPQIKQFLDAQRSQSLRSDLVAKLRKEHDVEVILEPVRLDVDIADATLKGAEEAPVTIVEFSDFQCPACRGFNPVLTQVLDAYGDKVRVAFLQFPLRSIHPEAQKAAEAALCARDQDKFWEMHDVLFANQKQLALDQLRTHAEAVGLDLDGFNECLDSDRYSDAVQADVDRAAQLGATGTPTVLVNGRPTAAGRVPNFAILKALIDDELARLGAD